MRKLELWYEFASTYSYLSVMRVEAVAAAAKVEVAWRPFLLGLIFRAQGWSDSPFNLFPAKGRYMWRDMERLAAGYGLPFRRPSVFPRNGLSAARIALLAEGEGWCPDWTRAVFSAEFAHDRDIASVIARRFVLFVRRLVLLVDDDEFQVLHRRKYGGTRADHHPRLSGRKREPAVQPLAFAQMTVPDHAAMSACLPRGDRTRNRFEA